MSSKLRSILRVATTVGGLFFTLLWGEAIFASGQDLTSLVKNVQTNVQSLSSLMVIISYLAGIVFVIAGIIQFKAHKDNPQQVPLSKPLVYIGVGAALLFLPSILKTAGSTLFGSQGGTSAAAGSAGV